MRSAWIPLRPRLHLPAPRGHCVTVTNCVRGQDYSDRNSSRRQAGCRGCSAIVMAEELPGFIPHILRADDVSLLRADETVFNAMVDGWRAQMLARGLAVDTIAARGRLIARFVEFANEYPWRWRPIDVDQFLAEFRSQEKPIALSTLRTYSNTISMFCSYVCDSRYGWVAFCEKQFGDVPSQICFEWNTLRNTQPTMPFHRAAERSPRPNCSIYLTWWMILSTRSTAQRRSGG